MAGPAVVLGAMTAATVSVVRYEPWIVATYTAAAALLAATCLRRSGRPSPPVAGRATSPDGDPSAATPDSRALAAAVAACGLLVALVPGFTYLRPHAATTVRLVWLATATVTAVVLLLGEVVTTRLARAGDRGPRPAVPAAVLVAGLGHVVASILLLRGDPAPSIDVWYTLQGAADALAGGRDIYREVWLAPPGVMAAFTYLPWTAVLLAPARWLTGDVRVGLVVLGLGSAALVGGLGRAGTGEQRRRAAAAGALLLLLPGSATQIEQAWTEPALLALLVAAAVAWRARRPWVAALALAVALASKQHVALLLPLLAAWPQIGLRRTGKVAVLAGVLVSPWLLVDARSMVDDTVGVLLRYPPMDFADTWVIAARHTLGWTPNLAVTGPVLLAALVLAVRGVRRDGVGLGELARWAAFVLLVANLLNKQGFYNQFWLVAALVVASWAVPDNDDSRAHQAETKDDGTVPATTPAATAEHVPDRSAELAPVAGPAPVTPAAAPPAPPALLASPAPPAPPALLALSEIPATQR